MIQYNSELTGCFNNGCHSPSLDNYCPETRQLNGKVSTFDEVVRNPCTKPKGEKGHQSICCPKGSLQSQLAAVYGAEPHEFPFMARYLPANCGGTIYNKRFVISAAHCTVDSKTFLEKPLDQGPGYGKQRVVIGSNSYVGMDPSYEYTVKKAHVHENYTLLAPNNLKTNLMLNDLVLLELDRDIQFGPNVMSLQLAPKDFDPRMYADQAFITGWGSTDTLQQSQHLQKSNIILRDPNNCFSRSQANTPYFNYEQDQDQLLCVGGILNGKWSTTAGEGDSGGPAICRGPKGIAVHCGVTSFSVGQDHNCLEFNNEEHCTPSIYAKVGQFREFIEGIAGKQDPKTFYKPYLYGAPVKKGESDHQVHITSQGGKPCGGTLVSDNMVVTAATCIMTPGRQTTYPGVQVHYGVKDLMNGQGGQTFDIETATHLYGFKMVGDKVDVRKQGNRISMTDNYYKNNLAIIKLKGRVPISPGKIPRLPEGNEVYENGRELAFPRDTKKGGEMRARDFKILEKEECQRRMTRLAKGQTQMGGVSMKVKGDVLCGVEKFSGGSLCDRELGGGLICKGRDGKDVLCGVQVFRLCEWAIPNIFVDMSEQGDWVKETMESFMLQG